MLKSNFKIFLIFILIFNLFTTTSLAATTKEAYNQEELMQYPGYGKAMYETILEETTFITGQYTDNKEFVNKSIDQIRDYGKFWWNEQNWESEAWTYDRFKEMVAKPTGYLLTVGDWVKKLFTGYGDEFYPPEIDGDSYNAFVEVDPRCSEDIQWCDYYKPKSGYVMILQHDNGFGHRYTSSSPYLKFWAENIYYSKELRKYYFRHNAINYPSKLLPNNEELQEYMKGTTNTNGNFAPIPPILKMLDVSISFETATGEEVKPPSKPNSFNKFKNYVDEKVSKMATPQPRPYLSCPNGTKIEMSISGSTFLGVDGKAMIVNKDGTAQVDSAICNLGWDKPEVKYLEGRPAIQTPDKGWQDVETGELIIPGENGGMQCVENGVVVPCNDIEKPDGSLLAYVKNAYEYATSLIDTAVDGLKQLSSGAVGLIELYKIYMSWLPTEIQTVMYSGLAIMIGLRVFRK